MRRLIQTGTPSRTVKIMAAFASLSLLAACATPFEARVQSFQQMPPIQGQSFVVQPADESRAGSLEFQSYAGLVSEELRRIGFQPASSAAGAQLQVMIDYGSGPGRERLATRPGTSSWGWYGRGWYSRNPLWWGSFYDPFWGSAWDRQEVYSFTVFPAYLEVDILRAQDKLPLFEGRAETTTRVNDLPATMPKLVRALFTDFPGGTSRSRVVQVPAEK